MFKNFNKYLETPVRDLIRYIKKQRFETTNITLKNLAVKLMKL